MCYTRVVVYNNSIRALEFVEEVAQTQDILGPHGLGVLDFNGYRAKTALYDKIDLGAGAGAPIAGLHLFADHVELPQNLFADHGFPGTSHLRMHQKLVQGRGAQQIMQNAGVAQKAFGVLDQALHAVRRVGGNVAPQKSSVGDFQVLFDGLLRGVQVAGQVGVVDNISRQRGQRSDELPVAHEIEAGKVARYVAGDIGIEIIVHPELPETGRLFKPRFRVAAAQPVFMGLLQGGAGTQRVDDMINGRIFAEQTGQQGQPGLVDFAK